MIPNSRPGRIDPTKIGGARQLWPVAVFATAVLVTFAAVERSGSLDCNRLNIFLLRYAASGGAGPTAGAVGDIVDGLKARGADSPCVIRGEGRFALFAKRYREAVVLLSAAAASEPGNLLDLYYRGQAAAGLGEWPLQIESWEKAGYGRGLLAVERQCRAERNLPCVVQSGTAAINVEPEAVWAYLDIGATLDEAGRVDEARQWYERGRAIAPGSPFPPMLAAWSHARQGDETTATFLYHQAIAVQPSEPYPHYEFGMYLWRLGATLDAREQFDLAIESQPEGGYQLRVANFYHGAGDFCSAATLYRSVLNSHQADRAIEDKLQASEARCHTVATVQP